MLQEPVGLSVARKSPNAVSGKSSRLLASYYLATKLTTHNGICEWFPGGLQHAALINSASTVKQTQESWP